MTARASPLPTGTVTLLFTDIEGSTQHWEAQRAVMPDALRRHDDLVRAAIEAHHGHVFKTVGDAFCAAFWRASDAVGAGVNAQRALAAQDFSAVGGLQVRMALHSGTADERDGDYFGPAPNRAARLLAVVHGGQVVVSGATAQLLRGELPNQMELRDLGEHRLKDLVEPERVWQLLAPGLPETFPALRSLDSLPNNLPRQVTALIGRNEVLVGIEALVGEFPLVTLVGTGGVGKTRAALQVGADLLDGSGDGVWFVELAPLSDPALVAGTLASALGVREQPERSMLDTLLHYLRRKRLLLIIDNCEHVIEEVATIADAILRACPEVRLLATSREPLRIDGEHVYRMPSLSVPSKSEALTAEDAVQYGAIALFAQRAAASDAKFKLTDESAPIVAEICRRLDGIALAIELAAARVKVLAPRQLSQKLDERFRVLTGGSRTALPRQQTMRALIDWSYNLLSEREQMIFRRLAIFAGGWTPESASEVCSHEDAIESWEILDALSALVDKSLVAVEFSENASRYYLLESIRAYGREQLAQAGETEAIARRHALWALAFAEHADGAYGKTPTRKWLDQLAPEIEELRAALVWTLAEGHDAQVGARLTAVLFWAWPWFGAPEAYRWVHAALGAIDESTPTAVTAYLHLGNARVTDAMTAYAESVPAAQEALELYESLGDGLGAARAQSSLGKALGRLGKYAESDALIEQALATFRELGTTWSVFGIMNFRARLCQRRGDLVGARRYAEEALAMARSLENDMGLSSVHQLLAEIEFGDGEIERALSTIDIALAGYRSLKDQLGTTVGLLDRAHYLTELARYDEARVAARESLELAPRVYDHAGLAEVFYEVVHLLVAVGAMERAARLVGYADACIAEHGRELDSSDRQLYQRFLALLREGFSEDEFARLKAEGAQWTEDQAISEARQI